MARKQRRGRSAGNASTKTPTRPPVLLPLSKQYDLADLVSRITRKNRHEEIDLGPPVGNEA
jgi:hypothetical protein